MSVRAILLVVCLAGCASARPVATPVLPGTQPDSRPAVAVQDATRLSPLTEREAQLLRELKLDVEYLAQQVGERNRGRRWELAAASDWIAQRLESLGLPVTRSGVESGTDAVAVDVEALVRGRGRARETVVLAAPYDSSPGSPGADDNATGVAALLALARSLGGLSLSRSLHLVVWSRGGSQDWARRLGEGGHQVVAVLSLYSLGYYSQAQASQRCPEGLFDACGRIGDFAAVVAAERSRQLAERVSQLLRDRSSLPVRKWVMAEGARQSLEPELWRFEDSGFSAAIITDTAALRNPQHRGPGDLPATLDFERLARLVAGLEQVVRELTDVEPEFEPELMVGRDHDR